MIFFYQTIWTGLANLKLRELETTLQWCNVTLSKLKHTEADSVKWNSSLTFKIAFQNYF